MWHVGFSASRFDAFKIYLPRVRCCSAANRSYLLPNSSFPLSVVFLFLSFFLSLLRVLYSFACSSLRISVASRIYFHLVCLFFSCVRLCASISPFTFHVYLVTNHASPSLPPEGGVEGDDVDLSDFKSQILRRTSIGGVGAVAPLSRAASRISILMHLQKTTSRANLLLSRESSIESSPSGMPPTVRDGNTQPHALFRCDYAFLLGVASVRRSVGPYPVVIE